MKNPLVALAVVCVVGALLAPAPALAADLTVVYEVKAHTPTIFGEAFADVQSKTKEPVDTTTQTKAFYKNHQKRVKTGNGRDVTLTNTDTGVVYTLDTVKKTYTQSTVRASKDIQADSIPPEMRKLITLSVRPGKQTERIAGHTATNLKFTVTAPFELGTPPATITVSGEEWRAQGLLPASVRNADMARFVGSAVVLANEAAFAKSLRAIQGFPLASTVKITMQFSPKGDTAGYAKAFAKEAIIIKTRAKSVVVGPLADALFAPPADYKKMDY